MISHKHKFIYIHINHCAGTSIESALANFGHRRPLEVDEITRKDIFDDELPLAATQHLTALELKKFYGDKIWAEYFTFAFVANPFDRMITAFLQRGVPIFGHKNLLEFFEGPYCNVNDPISKSDYSDRAYKASRVRRMVSSSYSWLSDESGKLIDLDFIGRKESLAEDFQKVLGIIGIDAKLPFENRTVGKKHYSTYYDERTIKWVEERMREDINFFDYSFEEKHNLNAAKTSRKKALWNIFCGKNR